MAKPLSRPPLTPGTSDGLRFSFPKWLKAATLERAANLLEDDVYVLEDAPEGHDVRYRGGLTVRLGWFVSRGGDAAFGVGLEDPATGEGRVCLKDFDYWFRHARYLFETLYVCAEELPVLERGKLRDGLKELLERYPPKALLSLEQQVLERVYGRLVPGLQDGFAKVRTFEKFSAQEKLNAKHRANVLKLAYVATLEPGDERDTLLEELTPWIEQVRDT